MKILCVNCVFSEFGGVEIAALNLASGLVERGHEVHFLAARSQRSPLAPGDDGDNGAPDSSRLGIQRHYRSFPRTYAMGEHHGFLRKFLWHAQDLLHPDNARIFTNVVAEVRPDLTILHNITAIGLNIWRAISKSGLPCIQVIHDLSPICLNMARFRGGHQCSGLCPACSLQKRIRFSMIAGAANFAFVSPSHATLEEVERYADLTMWRREVISNPNSFLVRPRVSLAGAKPRLLYIGRLEAAKGIETVLRAARNAHLQADFEIDILGTGVLESSLRRQYADCPWIRFHGSVDQETVAGFMSRATVLLVPSQWLETVPGVAVHALFAGLPVLGSRIGGIPEHVFDGQTGRLISPGDESAWTAAIARAAVDRQEIAAWSSACRTFARRFDPALSLDKYEKLMHEMYAADTAHSHPSAPQ
jgi:glycosyltransferase involved in cell wall biosynthesis